MKKLISACLLTLSLTITQASSSEKRENYLTEAGSILGGFAKSLVLKTHTPSGEVIGPMIPLKDAYDACVRHPVRTLAGASAVALLPVCQEFLPFIMSASSAMSSGKDFITSIASKKISGPEKVFFGSVAFLSMASSVHGAITDVQGFCSNGDGACNAENLCPIPEGSFLASCNGTSTLHISSDPNVGPYCEYNGKCLPPVAGEPLVDNQFFYPAGEVAIKGVNNANGRISVGETSPSGHVSHASSEIALDVPCSSTEGGSGNGPCDKISGSFLETCTVNAETYVSSDPVVRNLNVPLCEVHSSCFDVDGTQVTHSKVLLNEKRMQSRIENCDGHPVQHPHGQDNLCKNNNGSIAKRIGQESKIGRVLGSTKLLPSKQN